MGNCWGTKISSHNIVFSPCSPAAGSNKQCAGDLILSASQRHSRRSSSRSEGEILQSANVNVRSFSFNELRTSTRNFRPDSVLGEGGFGSVFKGWIDEETLAPTRPGTGMVIAVKKLNQQGFQGHGEWLNYNAKLSDFGLAKDGPTGDKSHIWTCCS